ncbi:MAG TPA: hypothetical protein VKB49_25060, partial [Candidatus Sulfotelmatobacter sp.]|nr:hypothetical protein [Candidatus Sulfotelmatobacter sp.]
KTLRATFDESEPGGTPSSINITIAFPDSMHVEVQTPQGQLIIVSAPNAGFMSMAGMGTRSVPPAQKDDMMAQLHHDLIYVAQHANDPAVTFTAAGTETIGDVEADIVDIGGAIPWLRWYVDPKTGYILREKYKGVGQTGPFDGETNLSDWRATDGVTQPYMHKNKQNGQETSVVEYKKLEINPTVDPKLFEKPAETSSVKPSTSQ